MNEQIAFIGLGNMGAPMAGNLVRAGYDVIGFDLAEPCRESARVLGVRIAASSVHAAAEAQIVFTMLPAGRHVLAVWEDLVGKVRPGTLLIDSSTIDVASARRAHECFVHGDFQTLDAPVSGGVAGAAAATLTFMVGGTADAFSRAEPVLQKLGKRAVHCGDAGAGQAAKICNNMILGVTMAGVCEAFVLAERLGLTHQALFDVASTSSGQCWSISNYCPVPGPVPGSPANNRYKPGFSAALMLKDLMLAQEAARAVGAATPMGAEAAQLYALFDMMGKSDMDFSGIIHMLRSSADIHGS